jgi:uncharacterized protein (DUF1786 family)
MKSTLFLDIGSGTQDVLYYRDDVELENCSKFVLPSPAKMIAKRIMELTNAKRDIYMFGSNMGGGFFGAMKKHLDAGFHVAIHPEAAYALNDDPKRVAAIGVTICDSCPSGYVPVELCDYNAGWWSAYFGMAGLPNPDEVIVAAQDHGVHEEEGNRIGRFRMWNELLTRHEGNPYSLLYRKPTAALTRLATIQKATGGGCVADSASAAVLGALYVPEVAQRSWRTGVLIVNVGNSHISAFLVYKEKIYGVYEHHTGMLSKEELVHDLTEFRRGWLTNEMVRDAGGHGCMNLELPDEAEGFFPAYLLGPKRAILDGQGVMIAPGGDMMLAGCFGLLKASQNIE